MSNTYLDIRTMRMRCEVMIISLVGIEAAPTWWNSPNKAFGGEIPNKVFDNDPERVYSYVVGHVDGYG